MCTGKGCRVDGVDEWKRKLVCKNKFEFVDYLRIRSVFDRETNKFTSLSIYRMNSETRFVRVYIIDEYSNDLYNVNNVFRGRLEIFSTNNLPAS